MYKIFKAIDNWKGEGSYLAYRARKRQERKELLRRYTLDEEFPPSEKVLKQRQEIEEAKRR